MFENRDNSQGHWIHQACIAAQGPLHNTVNDFWRMIVEKNCTKIAMVTDLKESSKVK